MGSTVSRGFVVLSLLPLVLLAGCRKDKPVVDAGAPALAEGVFMLADPRVGTKVVHTFGSTADLTMTHEGTQHTMKTNDHSTYTAEFLEVEGDTVKKAKLTYGEVASADLNDGKPEVNQGVVSNKAYLLELAPPPQPVVVTRVDGQPVTDAEREAVLDDADFLGGHDSFTSAMPKHALTRGEAVPELGKALKHLVNDTAGKADAEVVDSNVIYQGDRGEVGLFKVTLTMKLLDPEVKSEIALSGTLELRKADTELLLIDLKGPFKMGVTELNDVGTMTMKLERRFQ